MEKNSEKEKIIESLFSGKPAKRYRGKHVVVIGDEVHVLPYDEQEADRLFEKLEKEYPEETPTLLFVPKEESYILLCR